MTVKGRLGINCTESWIRSKLNVRAIHEYIFIDGVSAY